METAPIQRRRAPVVRRFASAAIPALLLALMAVLAGGPALKESMALDEGAHIGAGLSYVQKLDLRLNEEHPPLAKIVSVILLAAGGTSVDYSFIAWTVSGDFYPGFFGEWIFGDRVVNHWNNPRRSLTLARLPMLGIMLAVLRLNASSIVGICFPCANNNTGTVKKNSERDAHFIAASSSSSGPETVPIVPWDTAREDTAPTTIPEARSEWAASCVFRSASNLPQPRTQRQPVHESRAQAAERPTPGARRGRNHWRHGIEEPRGPFLLVRS